MKIDTDPPSATLVESMRVQIRTDATYIANNGGGKVRRVRAEVEFGSGETIVIELRPEYTP